MHFFETRERKLLEILITLRVFRRIRSNAAGASRVQRSDAQVVRRRRHQPASHGPLHRGGHLQRAAVLPVHGRTEPTLVLPGEHGGHLGKYVVVVASSVSYLTSRSWNAHGEVRRCCCFKFFLSYKYELERAWGSTSLVLL